MNACDVQHVIMLCSLIALAEIASEATTASKRWCMMTLVEIMRIWDDNNDLWLCHMAWMRVFFGLRRGSVAIAPQHSVSGFITRCDTCACHTNSTPNLETKYYLFFYVGHCQMREYKYGKARTIQKQLQLLTTLINNKHNNKHIYDSSGVQPSKRSAVAKLISSSGRLPLQPKTTSFELPT